MKHSFLKDLVILGIVILVVGAADELLSKHNYNFKCLLDPKTYTNKPIHTVNVPVNDTIYIKGLGNFKSSSLDESKRIVESKFGVTCVIDGSEKTKNDMYFEGTSKLEVNDVIRELRGSTKVFFITNEPIYNRFSGHNLRGFSQRGSNITIIRTNHLRETIIHEFGHNLGLEHCEDKTCIMAIYNDKEDSGDFCNDCKLKLKLK
jgi:predicted Zn-dependent protease